jgi:hypothetical protein
MHIQNENCMRMYYMHKTSPLCFMLCFVFYHLHISPWLTWIIKYHNLCEDIDKVGTQYFVRIIKYEVHHFCTVIVCWRSRVLFSPTGAQVFPAGNMWYLTGNLANNRHPYVSIFMDRSSKKRNVGNYGKEAHKFVNCNNWGVVWCIKQEGKYNVNRNKFTFHTIVSNWKCCQWKLHLSFPHGR